MIIKVYVDVLFIINFIIDYTLLCITSLFVKKIPTPAKTSAAAAFGAIYAAMIFFVPLSTYFIFMLSLIVSLIMMAIAYGIKNAVLLLKNTMVFYLVSFVAGGAGLSLLFLGNRQNSLSFAVKSGIFYADVNAYTLLAIFLSTITVIHCSVGYVKKQRIKSRYLYKVTIKKNGKSVTDTALFDTGNFLRDPILKRSVIIAEWQSVSPLFSETTLSACIAKQPDAFLYIPCRGFGADGGLFAFTPDEIVTEKALLTEPVLVGVSETLLDKEGSYRMILPNDFAYANRTERM